MRGRTVFAQVACLAGLAAVVGWPQIRPAARAVKVWRANGPLTPRPDLIADDQRIAYDKAANKRGVVTGAVAEPGRPSARQGARDVFTAAFADRGGGRSMVRGRVRTTLNRPVSFAVLALRNRLTGGIEATTTADSNGEFAFGDLTAGVYVVELLGADGAVIAATEMTAVAGGTQLATLRIGTNGAPRALFGSTTRATGGTDPVVFGSTAAEPIGRAAAAGFTQATEPNEDASPRH